MNSRKTEMPTMDARESKKIKHKRRSKGLCIECGDNPENNAISNNLCLDCFNSIDHCGCSVGGCPNPVLGTFSDIPLCRIHLIDEIHSNYQNYEQIKSRLEEKKKELKDKADQYGMDLDNLPHMDQVEREDKKELIASYFSYYAKKHRAIRLKNDIRSATKFVDEAFPENYSRGI